MSSTKIITLYKLGIFILLYCIYNANTLLNNCWTGASCHTPKSLSKDHANHANSDLTNTDVNE